MTEIREQLRLDPVVVRGGFARPNLAFRVEHVRGDKARAERAAESFSAMASDGLRLDAHTIDRLAEAQARQGRLSRWGIWLGALSLAARTDCASGRGRRGFSGDGCTWRTTMASRSG